MNRAVFLDRDGVLCKDTNYILSKEQLNIFPYAAEAVANMHSKGYRVIVVTNQSAVARGMMEQKVLEVIHQYLKEQTQVDDVFYCPHLFFDGMDEAEPYRIKCSCRKPLPGMLLKAAEQYEINMRESYMAGDRVSDLMAGKAAEVKTVFIASGVGKIEEMGEYADAYYENLLTFSEHL